MIVLECSKPNKIGTGNCTADRFQKRVSKITHGRYRVFYFFGYGYKAGFICPHNYSFYRDPVGFLRHPTCDGDKRLIQNYKSLMRMRKYNKRNFGSKFSILKCRGFDGKTRKYLVRHNYCGVSRWLKIFTGRCLYCSHVREGRKLSHDLQWLDNKVRKITNGRYKVRIDLSTYHNLQSKVYFECPNNHVFKSTAVVFFYQGSRCPICANLGKSRGEQQINKYLRHYKMPFKYGYVTNIKTDKGYLHFDFWIKKYRIAIEFDGVQHFTPVDFSGKKSHRKMINDFNTLQAHDRMKNDYCHNHNIKMIRIKYTDYKNIDKILDHKLNKLIA